MRSKIAATAFTTLGVFLNPLAAFADEPRDIKDIKSGATALGGIPVDVSLGTLIINALKIIYIIAALAVLFMLVVGAFQWIVSGGDKEAVQKARGRITAALVGLAILALALFITVLISSILGINILDLGTIPTLSGK